jgi:hypothetical protein
MCKILYSSLRNKNNILLFFRFNIVMVFYSATLTDGKAMFKLLYMDDVVRQCI